MLKIINFLNQPQIKEEIKNATGLMICLLGAIELILFLFRKKKNHEVKSTSLLLARLSILINPFVTKQGISLLLIIEKLSPFRLDFLFKPSTIFAVNPYHPKHLISILVILFALPAFAKKTITHQANHLSQPPIPNRIIYFLVINIIISRPFLHTINTLLSSKIN